jgi:hypothetical protein
VPSRSARELGVGGEAADAGDLADQLCGGQHAAAAFGEQLRGQLGDEPGELALERIDRARELADASQLVSGDSHLGDLLGARQPRADAVLPLGMDERARRDLELGPQIVQAPAQGR